MAYCIIILNKNIFNSVKVGHQYFIGNSSFSTVVSLQDSFNKQGSIINNFKQSLH